MSQIPSLEDLFLAALVRVCTITTPQKGWVSPRPACSTDTCCLLPHPCSCAAHRSAIPRHLMHIYGLK